MYVFCYIYFSSDSFSVARNRFKMCNKLGPARHLVVIIGEGSNTALLQIHTNTAYFICPVAHKYLSRNWKCNVFSIIIHPFFTASVNARCHLCAIQIQIFLFVSFPQILFLFYFFFSASPECLFNHDSWICAKFKWKCYLFILHFYCWSQIISFIISSFGNKVRVLTIIFPIIFQFSIINFSSSFHWQLSVSWNLFSIDEKLKYFFFSSNILITANNKVYFHLKLFTQLKSNSFCSLFEWSNIFASHRRGKNHKFKMKIAAQTGKCVCFGRAPYAIWSGVLYFRFDAFVDSCVCLFCLFYANGKTISLILCDSTTRFTHSEHMFCSSCTCSVCVWVKFNVNWIKCKMSHSTENSHSKCCEAHELFCWPIEWKRIVVIISVDLFDCFAAFPWNLSRYFTPPAETPFRFVFLFDFCFDFVYCFDWKAIHVHGQMHWQENRKKKFDFVSSLLASVHLIYTCRFSRIFFFHISFHCILWFNRWFAAKIVWKIIFISESFIPAVRREFNDLCWSTFLLFFAFVFASVSSVLFSLLAMFISSEWQFHFVAFDC